MTKKDIFCSTASCNRQCTSGKKIIIQGGQQFVIGFHKKSCYDVPSKERYSSEYSAKFDATPLTTAGSKKKPLSVYDPNAPRNRMAGDKVKIMNGHTSQLEMATGSMANLKSESQEQYQGFHGGALNPIHSNHAIYQTKLLEVRGAQDVKKSKHCRR